MKAKFKINQKVKVNCENPFTGVVTMVLKFENPFSILKKKGYDYGVKADDDGQTYKCSEEEIEKI